MSGLVVKVCRADRVLVGRGCDCDHYWWGAALLYRDAGWAGGLAPSHAGHQRERERERERRHHQVRTLSEKLGPA